MPYKASALRATLVGMLAASIGACIASPVAAGAFEMHRPLVVTAGTAIPVHLVAPLSSITAHSGDRFAVAAAADVVVAGVIVVRDGAPGEGVVDTVDHAGKNGHSGTLRLHLNWITAVDGNHIALDPEPFVEHRRDRKLLATAATVAGVAALGVGGLFGHNFVHGKEFTLGPDQTLDAHVAADVRINRAKIAASER